MKYELNKQQHKKGKEFYTPQRMKKETEKNRSTTWQMKYELNKLKHKEGNGFCAPRRMKNDKIRTEVPRNKKSTSRHITALWLDLIFHAHMLFTAGLYWTVNLKA